MFSRSRWKTTVQRATTAHGVLAGIFYMAERREGQSTLPYEERTELLSVIAGPILPGGKVWSVGFAGDRAEGLIGPLFRCGVG